MSKNILDRQMATELLRYAVGTGILGVGMCFNKESPAALMNMHSARLFLTVREAREQWIYSGLEIPQVLRAGASVLASCSVLASGYSKTTKVLESVHLALHSACCIEEWISIRKAISKKSSSNPNIQIRDMHKQAIFKTATAIAELFSFAFGLWPIYLAVNIIKGIEFVYRTVSIEKDSYTMKVYELIKRRIS